MPKTNVGKKPIDPLAEKVLGRLACMHLKLADAAWPLMSESTLRNRLKAPEKLTREEIRHLAKKLDIPIDDLRALV